MTSGRAARTFSGLVQAAHPIPTAGVTVYTTVLAAAVGNGIGTCAVLAAAVFTGQLSIGWSNDRLDLLADRQVGRTDKPLATGRLDPRIVEVALGCAVVSCVVLSLLLGWRAGLLHLAAVTSGWVYNAWLKGTWFSPVPYAVSFGALPGIATLALPSHQSPAVWAVVAGGLLGVAANLTNALPDLERDRVTGFRGLPNRIGARASLLAAGGLLALATVLLAVGPTGTPGIAGWIALAITASVLVVGWPAMWRRAATRAPFYGLMVLVAVDIILIVAAGHRLRA